MLRYQRENLFLFLSILKQRVFHNLIIFVPKSTIFLCNAVENKKTATIKDAVFYFILTYQFDYKLIIS